MPFRPPPPAKVELSVVSSLFEDHMGVLLTQQAHTDVVFVAGSVGFVAHRFLLAAASPVLQRLLCSADPICELTGARSSSETSLVSENPCWLQIITNHQGHLTSFLFTLCGTYVLI